MGFIKELTYRKVLAKGDAVELEPLLGNQLQIERFVASKEIRKSSWKSIYEELYKILPENERIVLAQAKDELTLMGNYKVLWDRFTHREQERKLENDIKKAHNLYIKFWDDAETYEFEKNVIPTYLSNLYAKQTKSFTVLTKDQFERYAYGFKSCTEGLPTKSILANNAISAELFEKGYQKYIEENGEIYSAEEVDIENNDNGSNEEDEEKMNEEPLITQEPVKKEVNSEEDLLGALDEEVDTEVNKTLQEQVDSSASTDAVPQVKETPVVNLETPAQTLTTSQQKTKEQSRKPRVVLKKEGYSNKTFKRFTSSSEKKIDESNHVEPYFEDKNPPEDIGSVYKELASLGDTVSKNSATMTKEEAILASMGNNKSKEQEQQQEALSI